MTVPSSAITLSDKSRIFAQDTFDIMMDMCHGITGILISTVDGHAVIYHFKNHYEASRLAAMTSSLLALAESVAKETEQQHCRDVIVEDTHGYVLTLRVGKRLVLTSIASPDTNLGLLRSATRSGAEKLATFS